MLFPLGAIIASLLIHEVRLRLSILLLFHHRQVEVLVPPAVQRMPQEGAVTVMADQDVTLRCAGRGNPNPKIIWKKKVIE